MPHMLWIALSAQMVAPVPINFRDWWVNEMPRSVYAAGINRLVFTRTTVRPDGTIQGCEAERGSGNAQLDSVTCIIMMKHGKFHAARAADGSAAWGVFRTTINWVVREPGPKILRSDLEVTLNRLPDGFRSPVTVPVVFVVDEQGQPSSCVGEPVPGVAKRNLALAGIACTQLLKDYIAIPAKDQAGRPIPSIQDASVHLIADTRVR